MIELKLDQIKVIEQVLKNTPKQVPLVVSRAINRAAYSGRTQAGKSVRKEYEVKHRTVISTIKVKKASPNDLQADFRSKGETLKLMDFKVRPGQPDPNRKNPINVTVRKNASKIFLGGFVAQMKSGHMNVFSRQSEKRFPIKGHYGPSVPQMIGNEDVIEEVETQASNTLESRLIHEINRLVGGIT